MSEITMEALMRAKEKEMEEMLPAQEPAEEALTPQERQRVDEIKKEIDFLDPQTDVQYGVGAQRNIADFSQRILGQVRTKDSGTAGELLLELSEKVRNSDVAKIGNNEGILDKIPFLKSAKDRIRRLRPCIRRTWSISGNWNAISPQGRRRWLKCARKPFPVCARRPLSQGIQWRLRCCGILRIR